MLLFQHAAFLISGISPYQIRIFTIPENVSLLCTILKNYELSSNYSSAKKEQYRSIIEC